MVKQATTSYTEMLAANDTMTGGTGDDTVHGGHGNDTYIFSRGDGVDVIRETSGIADEVRLGHDMLEVVFERINKDLRVRMPGSLDSITINSWYQSENYKIETFKSNNGQIITNTQKILECHGSRRWLTSRHKCSLLCKNTGRRQLLKL